MSNFIQLVVRRLDTSIAIQIEKFHADAEERKKEKEAARLRREAALAARWAFLLDHTRVADWLLE